MRIRLADGSSVRAEDYRDDVVEQWLEQTPKGEQTFESFQSFMKLAGFDWGHEWMVDQWDQLHEC